MKQYKKVLAIVFALVLMMSMLASCGGGSGSNESEEIDASEDTQNPVMNYIGDYGCGRATMTIEAADGETGANVLVTWGSSAAETSQWQMSGEFDADTKTITYSNGVRTDIVYKDEGDIDTETEVYNDGTGTITFTDDEENAVTTLVWKDDKEDVANDMVFEFAGINEYAVNPWSETDSAEEAAEGSGIDALEIADGTEISLGEVKADTYRYMDGMIEVKVEFPAVEMTIRKGDKKWEEGEGDISGDYGEYEHEWTQSIKGLEVKCFGNREGEATKTIWSLDDYDYAIVAYGLGGDDDYGLSADDLNSLINSMQ